MLFSYIFTAATPANAMNTKRPSIRIFFALFRLCQNTLLLDLLRAINLYMPGGLGFYFFSPSQRKEISKFPLRTLRLERVLKSGRVGGEKYKINRH
jgi:hypothetical protein